MECKKSQALSAGFSFSTFEKRKMLGKVCGYSDFYGKKRLESKHDPGFLISFSFLGQKEHSQESLANLSGYIIDKMRLNAV